MIFRAVQNSRVRRFWPIFSSFSEGHISPNRPKRTSKWRGPRFFYSLFFLLLFSSLFSAVDHAWMDKVIEKEFAPFKKEGISKALIESTWEKCKNKKEFKRFQIIDSKVYGEDTRIKKLLTVLTQKYKVPDVDFIYFYEDRIKPCFFKRKAFKKSAPFLVSAKSKSLSRAILFADWIYDIETQEKGWNFLIQKMNELQTIRWEEKIDKLFWRGTPWDGKHFDMYTFDNWTSIPRGKLVHLSRQHPELIDAAFSEYPKKCREDPDRCKQEMGEISFVPWEEVAHFKYQMAIDGVTCSFPATQWKLLLGALAFKQETPDVMYFYDALIPWEHYIPVKQDLSDLLTQIKWAKSHDAEAKRIAQNGREFALTHLMPEHLLLYCYKVLVRYASLQVP